MYHGYIQIIFIHEILSILDRCIRVLFHCEKYTNKSILKKTYFISLNLSLKTFVWYPTQSLSVRPSLNFLNYFYFSQEPYSNTFSKNHTKGKGIKFVKNGTTKGE